MMEIVFDKNVNIVEKGENAGYQFLFFTFPIMFSKGFYFRVIKVRLSLKSRKDGGGGGGGWGCYKKVQK